MMPPGVVSGEWMGGRGVRTASWIFVPGQRVRVSRSQRVMVMADEVGSSNISLLLLVCDRVCYTVQGLL